MDDKSRKTLLLVALAAVLVLVVVIAVILLKPQDTTPPATPSPEATTTQVPAEDAWSRIKAAGKMVVGTSADYPPFEYYTPDFKLDGFDIALIRGIGERLGVDIEVRDMAFDGLGGALRLGQIDMAIAAISVTSEREQAADFTNVYFVSEDAILARQDSSIGSIDSVEKMAGQRIGVQRASVYEDWLQENLVGAGLMPASNLFVYGAMDQAVKDLTDGRVDLVVLDLPPAQAFAQQGGLKIVGQGLNRQRFAMAITKGQEPLRTELNRALGELQDAGVISHLAKQYLGLNPDDLLPLPTPSPTSEPGKATPTTVPPACTDGMALVAHLTYDDKGMTAPPQMMPGQAFEKVWRVRNIGNCTWDGSYTLAYVGGNVAGANMGGSSVAIAGTVPPGADYDIKVNLVAPFVPGVYQGFWQMHSGKGVSFGDRIWVGIHVPMAATPTPAPTQTPSPNIQFSADRTHIKAGERVVFTWNVTDVKAVYFYEQGQPWEQNGVPGQGSREVWPPTTTVYELRVVHLDNRVEVRQIRIEVEPVVGAPHIARFTVDPPHQITVGQCLDIQWDVQGEVSKVTILRNNAPLWDDAPVRGNYQDCPPGAGGMEYAIVATGPGGTSRLVRHINVVESATATPVPTPAPEAPVIHAFAVR